MGATSFQRRRPAGGEFRADPRRIAGSVLGLWGHGAAARAVAIRARALGMRVLVHARRPTASPDADAEHVS